MKKIPKNIIQKLKSLIKQNIHILPNYKFKDYEIELLKDKQALFVQNYKLLLEQKTNAMKKYIDKYLEKKFY